MSKYYAYIPREDGTEPTGTGNRYLFEAANDVRAKMTANEYLRTTENVLITYTNLYDEKTYRVIKGEYKQYANN